MCPFCGQAPLEPDADVVRLGGHRRDENRRRWGGEERRLQGLIMSQAAHVRSHPAWGLVLVRACRVRRLVVARGRGLRICEVDKHEAEGGRRGRAEGGCSFGRLGATFPPAGSSVTSKPTGVWRPRRAGTSSGASRSARHAEPEGVTANGDRLHEVGRCFLG